MKQYTVKKLAKLSGVSVRTLHWYDEIALLKPAFYDANGYRCYEEEQLLTLQQILFFKELGFPLKDIQKILASSDFDKMRALSTHKKVIQTNIERQSELLQTIDSTLQHLEGKRMMNDNDLYKGFDENKQETQEKCMVQYLGTVAEDLIHDSKKKNINWENQEWDDIKNEANIIYAEISNCLDQGLTTRSNKVQALIHKHFLMSERFYTVTKDVYMALAQLYCEHPYFIKFFEAHQPKLAEFIAEAMRVYAMNNL